MFAGGRTNVDCVCVSEIEKDSFEVFAPEQLRGEEGKGMNARSRTRVGFVEGQETVLTSFDQLLFPILENDDVAMTLKDTASVQ
jgi:hypothetical protein